jgi:hypothetical protein
MRFGHTSEALSAGQRDLFQEAWNTDQPELETEVELLQAETGECK